MESFFDRFYQRLPVREIGVDDHLHLLNGDESAFLRENQRNIMSAAAILSVIGFIAYYEPVERFPRLFPSLDINIPLLSLEFALQWGSLLWAVFLTVIEMFILTLMNIYGVHQTAVATGLITAGSKSEHAEGVLNIGLERKVSEASRFGIDPFQGLSKWVLFLFNMVLRLKGFLASQAIRYLLRLFLGRYAVRSLLNYSGLPIYMALNAYSVYAVMREARVVIMGQTIVRLLVERLPKERLSDSDKALIYDTLQYIAVSKRDFHRNHYLLTKQLLDHFQIPAEERHYLPEDYLDKLKDSPAPIRALCELIIILGFVLDGRVSWLERAKLRELNSYGIIMKKYSEVREYAREFLNGKGIDRWSENYLSRMD